MRRFLIVLSLLLVAGGLFAGPPRNVTYTYGTGTDTGRVTSPSGVILDWVQNINGYPASTYITESYIASYATLEAAEAYADSALADAEAYADGLFTTANEYSEQLNASEADSRIAGDAATLASANGYTDSAIAAIPDFGVADTSWTGDNWTVTNESPSQRAAQEALLTRASQMDLNSLDSDLAEHVADTANPHGVDAADVGLGNVDNTADLDKPISTLQQAALDLKLDADSAVSGGHGIQDNGTPMTTRANLNFIGFTVTDDSGNDATKVELPPGQEEIEFTSADSTGVSWAGDVVTFIHSLGVAGVLGEFFNSAGGGGYRLTLADNPTTTSAAFDMTPLGGNAAVTGTWKVRLVANAVGSGGGGSGASAFTDLTDAPSSYSGQGGKLVAVNSGATAWEFVDSPTTGMENPMTAAGDLIVGGTDGAAARLAKGTEGQVLTMGASAPGWAAPAAGGSLETGSIIQWPSRTAVPSGFLRADGQDVSRTTYSELYALLGTGYGAGDGSTTFAMPNAFRPSLRVGTQLLALSQTARSWTALCAAANGDIYACVYGGDIYIRSGGAGDFTALSQTARNWYALCAAANGDIYACVYGGDIYIRSGGAGDFTALSQTARNWRAMTTAPNGDIYAAVDNGDIYIRSGGAGDFTALSQTARAWRGMAAANGNIYATVTGGDIYIRSGGAGDFTALSQTTRAWEGLSASPNGDVYAAVSNGDVYMQLAGVGTFAALLQATRNWVAVCVGVDGDVYAAVFNGDIYRYPCETLPIIKY